MPFSQHLPAPFRLRSRSWVSRHAPLVALLVLFGLALLVLTLVAPATFAAATPPAAVQAGCAVGHGATASAVGAVCSPPPGSFGAWGGAIWMFLGIFALVCLVLRWRLRG